MSTKQLTLSLQEYNQDLQTKFNQGVQSGVTRLAAILKDVLENDGANIDIAEDADQAMVDLINQLKDLKAKANA